MSLLFDPFESIILFLSVLMANYTMQDGRSNWRKLSFNLTTLRDLTDFVCSALDPTSTSPAITRDFLLRLSYVSHTSLIRFICASTVEGFILMMVRFALYAHLSIPEPARLMVYVAILRTDLRVNWNSCLVLPQRRFDGFHLLESTLRKCLFSDFLRFPTSFPLLLF